MPCDRRALSLLLGVAVTTAAHTAHAERPVAAPAAPPSAELLEFLGGFETNAGKAVDPFWFLDDGNPTKAADSKAAPATRTPGAATPPETKP